MVLALEEKKAEDIVLLDLRGISMFTDYFVICSGTSDRMLRSLLKTAKECMHVQFDRKGDIQGIPSNGWIAVDYGDLVLHLFSPEQRNYYLLEELWAEGKILLRVK
ncbi:MAG: ribosome silencing factor [Pelolinea sp.]|nr:ribosome silencing factor [Pelolinea sp.]